MNTRLLNGTVSEIDPELFEIIQQEEKRQKRGLEMTASENYTPISVLQCLGSCIINKNAEGVPHRRYNGGCTYIDKIELLAQQRCLEAFKLNSDEWGVNVQPLSGSPANLAVYTGIVEPHGRIMGLDITDGGHLTHGFFTDTKKISSSSIFFENLPYKVDPVTGLIDYDKLAENAKLFKPRLIIAGTSCYSRYLDYKRFRQTADESGAYLLGDMAHISGLVVAGVIPSPFEYCDIVTTTTHKTLRGPRGGVVFYRKGVRYTTTNGDKIMYDLESKINEAVFPGIQGGAHNNTVAAIATAMKQATDPEFVEYQKQVIRNAQHLCEGLKSRGYVVVSGGTDVHLVLVDLRGTGLNGVIAERILDLCTMACNKNTVPGDTSTLNPSGIRLGTPPLTTRGLKEKEFDKVVDYIDRAFKLAQEITKLSGLELVDFNKTIEENSDIKANVNNLKEEVENFGSTFPVPGPNVL